MKRTFRSESIKYRRGTILLLVALLAAGFRPAFDTLSQTPNIVLIVSDDQGWGDVHTHGNSDIDTPTLDRLARDGARFERFFVSPVCAPTRASLLTGRHHLRTGVHGVTRGYETMRAEEVTIGEIFRDAGYATGLFGKWHNGRHYPQDPVGQGFDTFFGFSAGHWNNYFDTDLVYSVRGGGSRTVETDGYITDVLTDSALAFIERHRAVPFLAYVPYNAPHGPFQVPDHYFDKYKRRGFDERTAAIYGMVENVDDNIDRILTKLDDLGIARETIVVFLTDNGPNGERYNGKMRGTKGSVHEGGVRVPLFVRYPGVIEPNQVIREPAAHIDLLPTLVEMAGLTVPEALHVDGLSLAPMLRAEADRLADRFLFTFWNREMKPHRGAVRTRRWRAVVERGPWQLYDMMNDPGEQVDVAANYPAVLDSLAETFDQWFDEVTAAGFEPIPTEIGHAERPTVELPGHEAFLRPNAGNGISYVGERGWANDWITNWTSDTAFPEWPVHVVRPGRYSVALRYNAPPEAVGTRLRVEVGDAEVEGTVHEAFVGERLPSPDRVPRGEVYERTWGLLNLGELTLDDGSMQLRVHLARRAAERGMDMKSVVLEYIGEP